MSYKIIALMLVLLIAGAMTATAYEFSVNYDANLQLQSAKFAGGGPIKPVISEEKKFPDGQLIKTVSLGEIICSMPTELAGGTIQATCYRHISCHIYPCPCPCNQGEVYDGDGNLLRVLDSTTGMKQTLGPPVPINKGNVKGVSKLSPLGELMIFKTPENKIIRCIVLGSQIITSPPSEE
jgi:hypothetical protein